MCLCLRGGLVERTVGLVIWRLTLRFERIPNTVIAMCLCLCAAQGLLGRAVPAHQKTVLKTKPAPPPPGFPAVLTAADQLHVRVKAASASTSNHMNTQSNPSRGRRIPRGGVGGGERETGGGGRGGDPDVRVRAESNNDSAMTRANKRQRIRAVLDQDSVIVIND